jgi:hypothetical protein
MLSPLSTPLPPHQSHLQNAKTKTISPPHRQQSQKTHTLPHLPLYTQKHTPPTSPFLNPNKHNPSHNTPPSQLLPNHPNFQNKPIFFKNTSENSKLDPVGSSTGERFTSPYRAAGEGGDGGEVAREQDRATTWKGMGVGHGGGGGSVPATSPSDAR